MGELLKYGGSGTVYLLKHLFGVVWQEVVPEECREGFICVNLFTKGYKEGFHEMQCTGV